METLAHQEALRHLAVFQAQAAAAVAVIMILNHSQADLAAEAEAHRLTVTELAAAAELVVLAVILTDQPALILQVHHKAKVLAGKVIQAV